MSDDQEALFAQMRAGIERLHLLAFGAEFWLEEAKHANARLQATVARLRALRSLDDGDACDRP
jgi:hypothetical protein